MTTLQNVWADFVSGSLTNTITAALAGVSQTMTSDGLMALPVVMLGAQRAKITFDPFAVNGSPELVYVTAHAANSASATIQRIAGQPLRQHAATETWVHGPTAEDFAEFQAQLNTFTYRALQVPVSGGPTAGTTELTIGSLSIAPQVSAYQLDCAAFWTGVDDVGQGGVAGDTWKFRIRVNGNEMAVGSNRVEVGNQRWLFSLPTSTLTNIAAATPCLVTCTIQRATGGSGTIAEDTPGLLTAHMSFFL